MHLRFTTRAGIALEQLPLDEQRRAHRFFHGIKESRRLSDLHRDIHKLNSHSGESLFVGRIGVRYRAILRVEEGIVEILEIVDHDRLKRTYGLGDQSV